MTNIEIYVGDDRTGECETMQEALRRAHHLWLLPENDAKPVTVVVVSGEKRFVLSVVEIDEA